MRMLSMLLVLNLGIATGTHAQDLEPLQLTLDAAQTRAIEESHRLAEAQARGAVAAANATAVEVADMPSIALDAGFTRTNHVTEFMVPSASGAPRVLYPDVPDNYRTRLGLQWPIYTGGRSKALKRAARAEASASNADVDVAQADLRLEVARVFWALVSADAMVAVFDRGVVRTDSHLDVSRERLRAGLVAPSDVASAEAQVSRQQMLLIEARNQRNVSSAQLARLVGVDLLQRIDADAKFDDIGAPPGELAVLVDAALATRGERRAIEFRIDAAEEQRIAVSLSMRPRVAVAAGVDLARPNPRIFPRTDHWEDSWDAGVNVTWPLWDGGRRAAGVERATQRTRATRERLAEFDSLVALEIRSHLLSLDSGRAVAAAAADVVAAADEARRMVTERYAAGVSIQVEVLDAEQALLQAELDRMRALVGIQVSEAELERALGR
jgi:outer membrane protein TolC